MAVIDSKVKAKAMKNFEKFIKEIDCKEIQGNQQRLGCRGTPQRTLGYFGISCELNFKANNRLLEAWH
jgi:hypothetical protein